MSTKKENTPEKNKKATKKDKKKSHEIDKELKQTFPASDPPSHTQPGHGRHKKDES